MLESGSCGLQRHAGDTLLFTPSPIGAETDAFVQIVMKDALAERLLAAVMNWKEEDVARERPDLQAMAAYKYDEYRQFSPGMRFVESFALWLNQFQTQEERVIAYDFVKKKLVFCSSAEMYHLVAMAY